MRKEENRCSTENVYAEIIKKLETTSTLTYFYFLVGQIVAL